MSDHPEITIVRVPICEEEAETQQREHTQRLLPEAQLQHILSANPLIYAPFQNVVTKERHLAEVIHRLKTLIGASCVGFTSTDRVDGIGAQALGKITTRVMATALDQDYVHTNFANLEHCDERMTPAAYCQSWETILKIGTNASRRDKYLNVVNCCATDSVATIKTQPFRPSYLYCFRDANSFVQAFREELVEPWQRVIQDIRHQFYASQPPRPSSERVIVAVHIRRGDVKEKSTVTSNRWLADEYYANVMKEIERQYKNVYFTIVSEGSHSDFKYFVDTFKNVSLHVSPPNTNNRLTKITQPQRKSLVSGGARNQHFLDRRKHVQIKKRPDNNLSVTNAIDAFNVMVHADILVLSRSLFSLLSGLYSKGIKIYPPGLAVPKWCETNDSWVRAING